MNAGSAAREDGVAATATRFRWAAAGGVAAALGIASCCLLPLVLVSVGLGGAWISGFGTLVPYQPVLIALAVGLLGYGHYLVYVTQRTACFEGDACIAPRTDRARRIVLWAATILAVVGIGIEYVEPWLLG